MGPLRMKQCYLTAYPDRGHNNDSLSIKRIKQEWVKTGVGQNGSGFNNPHFKAVYKDMVYYLDGSFFCPLMVLRLYSFS